MVGPFLFSFRFWITLIPLILCGIFILLAYLSRFRNPATVDVCRHLRGADVKRIFRGVLVEGMIGGITCESLEYDRLRLHEAREFMRAVFHDMGVLMAWSEWALRMELVEKPWEKDGERAEDSEKFVAAQRELLPAAREFRRYAAAGLVKINIALLFHAHWSLRWLMPGRLRPNRYRGLLAAYSRIFKAVVEVTALYDEGLPEEFLQALFRLKDPATEVATWRKAGIIMSSP